MIVAEGDVSEFYRSPERRQDRRPRLVGDLRYNVEQGEDPGGGGHALLDRGVDPADPLDRLVGGDQGGEKGEEGAGGGVAVDDLVAAEPDDQGDGDAADELHQRVLHAAEAGVLDDDREEGADLVAEALALVLFAAEGLDDAVAGDGLVEDVGDVGGLLLGPGAQLAEDPAELDDRVGGDRQDDEGEHRQLPVHVEDDAEEDDDLEEVAQGADQGVGDRLLHQGDVGDDARDQGPGRHVVEERQRLAVDMLEDLDPQVADDRLADLFEEKVVEIVADALEEEDQDDDQRQDVEEEDVLSP